MASPDACFNNTADSADRWLAAPDLDGHSGSPLEPTPTPFEVRRVDHPLGVVLVLRGELDLAAVPLLEEHLNRTMRGGASVVIDLAGVGFIDSTGLEVLLRADRKLRASDGQLVLLSGSPAVQRVFELAGIDGHFEWSDAPTAQAAPEPDGQRGGTT